MPTGNAVLIPFRVDCGNVPILTSRRAALRWRSTQQLGRTMGQTINLNTSGMQCIGAYVAKPDGAPKGGIVVVQEIFGVNAHVRSVTDRFAASGYVAIAPAFFDHIESNVELAYDDEAFKCGRALVGQISFDRALEDVASAAESIRSAGRIGVVGYCWGGTVALLAATRLGLPADAASAGRALERTLAFFARNLGA
jgi:dienelactone hydrolase